MKLKVSIISSVLAMLFVFQLVHATPKERIKARSVIQKTIKVILHARQIVKKNQVYTGDLAKAVKHQKYSRILFKEGKFQRAAFQSLRARHFARLAIQANKGKEIIEMKNSAEEEKLENKPADQELDLEVTQNMPADTQKDEDVINGDLKMDDLN